LKGSEYVAITTKAYRLAVDQAWKELHLDVDANANIQTEKFEDKQKKLKKTQIKMEGTVRYTYIRYTYILPPPFTRSHGLLFINVHYSQRD
jgi:collagenase-like PrtC family protease